MCVCYTETRHGGLGGGVWRPVDAEAARRGQETDGELPAADNQRVR